MGMLLQAEGGLPSLGKLFRGFLGFLRDETTMAVLGVACAVIVALLLLRQGRVIVFLIMGFLVIQVGRYLITNGYSDFDHPWPMIALVVGGAALFLGALYWCYLKPTS